MTLMREGKRWGKTSEGADDKAKTERRKDKATKREGGGKSVELG